MIFAVAHTLIVIIWHALANGVPYDELGGDYFERRDTNVETRRHVNALRRLGQDVTPHQQPDRPPTIRLRPSGVVAPTPRAPTRPTEQWILVSEPVLGVAFLDSLPHRHRRRINAVTVEAWTPQFAPDALAVVARGKPSFLEPFENLTGRGRVQRCGVPVDRVLHTISSLLRSSNANPLGLDTTQVWLLRSHSSPARVHTDAPF